MYISAIIHQADQMSMLVLYVLLPNKTSGALYHNVTTSFEKVLTGIPNARARPKSASFSCPLELIRRFLGLKIPVKYPIAVTELYSIQQLEHE